MSVDLGLVHLLGADAIGQPGRRQFRLYAQSARGSVIMWMEKEQLNSLSVVIDRALADITEGQMLRTEAQAHEELNEQKLTEGMPEGFPRMPNYEFQVGQIRLSLEDTEMQFLL